MLELIIPNYQLHIAYKKSRFTHDFLFFTLILTARIILPFLQAHPRRKVRSVPQHRRGMYPGR